jgi:hypothetical protein
MHLETNHKAVNCTDCPAYKTCKRYCKRYKWAGGSCYFSWCRKETVNCGNCPVYRECEEQGKECKEVSE